MAFASSLFRSSKFLEHTHTLTKRLTVLACSDNTKDVRRLPLPFSIFGSFYPNVRFIYFMSKYWLEIYKWSQTKLCPAKQKHNSCFFVFLLGAFFCAPPLSGALGDRLYRL